MKNKIHFVAVLAIVLTVFTVAVCAQNRLMKNSEKPLFSNGSARTTQCFVFPKYVVKTKWRDLSDGVDDKSGSDVSVFTRTVLKTAAASCDAPGAEIVSVENTEGNEFGGILNGQLFIEKSIFPDYGTLEIFNLQSGRRAYQVEFTEWADVSPSITGGRFVVFDVWSTAQGTAKSCPQAKKWKKDGLSVRWLHSKSLDLQTLKLTTAGALRCTTVN